MIEVFIGYTRDSNIEELEKTLEAWDKPGMEPVAIEIKPAKKFGLYRCVTAENTSRADYILADLGYGPFEEDFGAIAELELVRRKESGIIGACPVGKPWPEVPDRAVVCRKGVIKSWPTPRTETYIKEHVEAYRFAGYGASLCPTLHFHLLTVSLPS